MPKNRDAIILHQSPEPPAYLAGRILGRIEKEERKKTVRQAVISCGLLFVSFASSVASAMDLGTRLSHSGFLSFVSLFGSDFSSVVTNGREIFFSLMESLPALPAAFCVASIAFVVWFAVRLLKETVTIRRNRFAVRY